MTKEELHILLQEGEGFKTEFKERLNRSFAAEMVAFANASGGKIILGIRDDGSVKGIGTGNIIRSRIQQTANNCDPSVTIGIEVIDNIIVVYINEAENKPYSCSDGFFLRIGPNSQKLTRDQIISFIKSEGKIRFEELTNDKFHYPDDYNADKLAGFLSLSGVRAKAKDWEFLKNLGLTSGNTLNNAGILFFARAPVQFHEQATITCVAYDGKERVLVRNRKEYHEDLISNIDHAFQFVLQELKVQYKMAGKTQREEVYELPPDAIREAIVNAVSHRDYFEKGAHTVISVFNDRIEISNPGGLVPGLDKTDFGKRSLRRNPVISSLLYRAGFVENLGTGINKIKYLFKAYGLDDPVFEFDTFFTVIFKRKTHDAINDAINDAIKNRLKEELTFIVSREGTTLASIMDAFKIKRATAQRDMKLLKEGNLIIFSGARRTGKYIITNHLNKLIQGND